MANKELTELEQTVFGRKLQSLAEDLDRLCKESGKGLFTKTVLMSYLEVAYASGWEDRKEFESLLKKVTEIN